MNVSIIETSYPTVFRRRVSERLGQYLKTRQSVVLIGMKRVGISNFLRFFLYHQNIAKTYIGDQEKHIFIPVDLNDLVETEINPFWILTLKRIVDVVSNLNLDKQDKRRVDLLFLNSIQSQDPFFTLDSIRNCLNLIVDKGFLPDLFFIRFDRMKNAVTSDFFANLQGLKDAFHGKLAYVFTSFRSLDVLSSSSFAKASLSLFSKDLYIEPASPEDTQIICKSYIQRYRLKLSPAIKKSLFSIVDGYVQYLQLALITLHEARILPKDESELLSSLLKDERISLQSEELWENLSENEQKTLVQVAKGKKVSDDQQKKATYLWDTGFVKGDKIFSPIFADYVDKKSSESLENGVLDFTKKENLLLSCLKDPMGQLCEREKIIECVWPEVETLGVSDWAIDRLVSRVRSKLKEMGKNLEIQTVKTRGYKLISL